MIGEYQYPCPAGLFRITLRADARWHVMFEREDLGSYATAGAALVELVGGRTFMPSCGDPTQFGLPAELADWSGRHR